MQLDWSLDGNYLQTVTADYDLAFCKFKLYMVCIITTIILPYFNIEAFCETKRKQTYR